MHWGGPCLLAHLIAGTAMCTSSARVGTSSPSAAAAGGGGHVPWPSDQLRSGGERACGVGGSVCGEGLLAQRLGLPRDSKLLIVHVDDLGLAHAANEAGLAAVVNGSATSASVMMVAPHVAEVVRVAAAARGGGRGVDLGVHLTLTSEWPAYRWGPVTPAAAVPSLINSDGHFHSTTAQLASHAAVGELRTELQAQLDLALRHGLRPTHLDAHMSWPTARADFLHSYLALAAANGLPALWHRDWLPKEEPLRQGAGAGFSVPNASAAGGFAADSLLGAGPRDFARGLAPRYWRMLDSLAPGLNHLAIHPARDGAEMRAICGSQRAWGAQWRAEDYRFFRAPQARRHLESLGVHLLTWADVGADRTPPLMEALGQPEALDPPRKRTSTMRRRSRGRAEDEPRQERDLPVDPNGMHSNAQRS